MTEEIHKKQSISAIGLLSLAALGVVYGDIGTSPLYAVREIFLGRGLRHYTHADVIGGISVVFWALTLIVTIKYVIFVLKADSDGEGGVFALYSLIQSLTRKSYLFLILLSIFAAGLLFGDGIITPAISVLSAVEGLTVVTPIFQPFVLGITISILTFLFLIQVKGTDVIGKVFGPIMLLWFIVIGSLGGMHLVRNPEILSALNPWYAIWFVTGHDVRTLLLVLGSVMLVVTGGEAMYADMGHFGRLPIRLGWLFVAYPALILNYLGQGAYLLSGLPIIEDNLFFSIVPQTVLAPVVILATLATIIASQALISGAYSLVTQAISLQLIPYLHVKHTHRAHAGQIYVKSVNWLLYAGSLALVLYFQTSSRMASAYGLAVSGVMFITTLCMIVISKEYWKWPKIIAYLVFVPFVLIDGVFLFSNSLKFVEGGFIPVGVAFVIFILIRTWNWGRIHVKKAFTDYPVMQMKELIGIKAKSMTMLPRTIVIMTPDSVSTPEDPVPIAKQMFWDRYGMLPQHLIFLTVNMLRVPHARRQRYEIYPLYVDVKKGSITGVKVNFGFMENPDVEKILEGLAEHEEIPVNSHKGWLLHVMHERVRLTPSHAVYDKFRFMIFQFMQRNTEGADRYFGLGRRHPLTVEILPVVIK